MQGDPTAAEVHFTQDELYQMRVNRLYHWLERGLKQKLPRASIQHVGSTAVPGSLTKGDLDLCVRVSESDLDSAYATIASFFKCNGTVITATLQQFSTAVAGIPVGIQLVLEGGPEDFFVYFRDLLRADPELCEAYTALKRRHQGGTHETYRGEKSFFIQRILQLNPPKGLKGW